MLIFDGILGKYIGSDYTIELKEDAKPYHSKPYPNSKIHKPTLKKEVNWLIGENQSVALTFITPKINPSVIFI